MRTERRRRLGQSLVELALVLPLLVLLLMGVVDMGRAFHSYIVITNASREGARRASRIPSVCVAPDECVIAVDTIEAAVKQDAASNGMDLTEENSTITIRASEGLNGGDPISVTVQYTFTTVIGGLMGLPEFPVRSSTEMVIFGN